MLPDLLRSRNRRFRQVRLSRPAPCAIIFMRSPQCDKLDTLVIRSHCPRKLAVQHCLAQSAAISMGFADLGMLMGRLVLVSAFDARCSILD